MADDKSFDNLSEGELEDGELPSSDEEEEETIAKPAATLPAARVNDHHGDAANEERAPPHAEAGAAIKAGQKVNVYTGVY